MRIEGIGHLHRALARGVILLTAHVTPLELAGGVLAAACPVPLGFLCQPTKNEALTYALQRLRRGCGSYPIPSDDTRALVAALKRNACVWCAPDEADRGPGAQMVPMFGIRAASNTRTQRVARTTGAEVLPYFLQRQPGAQGHRATIQPPLSGFPRERAASETERFHRMIEAQVRVAPEQYLWIHRRCRGLSQEYPDYYAHR